MQGTVFRARPRKAAAFQKLVVETKSLTVPVKKLNSIPAPPPEGKHNTARGLLAQYNLSHSRQTCDPFAHVRHTARQIHTDASSRSNHAASIALINRVSAVPSMELSNRKLRPPCKQSSSETSGAGFGTGGATSGTRKSTDRNAAPASSGQRPFACNSCRHL